MPIARPAPKSPVKASVAAAPAPKSPVKASVAAAPAKPPVGSLMDRPMGPGGNLPMRPMPSTPAVQTSRPGPQMGSPVPVTPQPIRPGLGQGSVGQLQQAQMSQMQQQPAGRGGGLQGIGPRASELSMDQLRDMQMKMSQQAQLQQQNVLSQIPAYTQLQAIQGQLQGRQPTPQELQQMQMYAQQIESDPGFRQMQGNLQQMGQQFDQQYGRQLQDYARQQQAQQVQVQVSPPYMGTGGQGMSAAQMNPQQYQAAPVQNIDLVRQALGIPNDPGLTPYKLGQTLGGSSGGGMSGPGPYGPGMQPQLSPYNTTTQQNIMGGQMQGLGSAPMGTGGQGMPALGGMAQMRANMGTSLGGMPPPYAPKTEADWNKFSSMAFFAPGTDMAKAKADFLAQGQGQGMGGGMGGMGQPFGPYNTTTQQNIMGSPQAQPGVATPMGGGLGGLGNLAQARGPMNQMASTLQGFQQQAPVQPPMSQGTGVTQQPGSPPQQNRPTGGGIM